MYHSKGSFTFKDAYNLPIYLRKFYIQRLSKQYKEEHEAIKKEQQNVQKSIPKLNIPKK